MLSVSFLSQSVQFIPFNPSSQLLMLHYLVFGRNILLMVPGLGDLLVILLVSRKAVDESVAIPELLLAVQVHFLRIFFIR